MPTVAEFLVYCDGVPVAIAVSVAASVNGVPSTTHTDDTDGDTHGGMAICVSNDVISGPFVSSSLQLQALRRTQHSKAFATWRHTTLQLQSQLRCLNADMEVVRLKLNAHMERKPVVRLSKAVHVTPVIAGRKRGRESEPPTPVVAGRTGCEPQCPEEYCFAERVKSTKLILDQLGRVIKGPNGVVHTLDNIGIDIEW